MGPGFRSAAGAYLAQRQVRVRYVCMCVCMYACMYVCMYVRTYVCMYVCTHMCIYIYIYTHTRLYIQINKNEYIYIYIYMIIAGPEGKYQFHRIIRSFLVCLYLFQSVLVLFKYLFKRIGRKGRIWQLQGLRERETGMRSESDRGPNPAMIVEVTWSGPDWGKAG